VWNKWKTFSVIFKTLSRKWLALLAEQRGMSAPQPRNATKMLHLHPCNTKEIQKFNEQSLEQICIFGTFRVGTLEKLAPHSLCLVLKVTELVGT
jgi:hypothetical protein